MKRLKALYNVLTKRILTFQQLKLSALENNIADMEEVTNSGILEEKKHKLKDFMVSQTKKVDELSIVVKRIDSYMNEILEPSRQRQIDFLYKNRYSIAALSSKNYKLWIEFIHILDEQFNSYVHELVKEQISDIQKEVAYAESLNYLSSLNDDDKTVH